MSCVSKLAILLCHAMSVNRLSCHKLCQYAMLICHMSFDTDSTLITVMLHTYMTYSIALLRTDVTDSTVFELVKHHDTQVRTNNYRVL